jgi:hypothetical protein
MSWGLPATKNDIDSRVGSLIVAVRDALAACSRFSDFLSDTTIFPNDAALTALGYSQAEVTSLRAAFTDLKSLYNVAHGTASVAAPNDFFFNAKHGTGTVV